MIGYILKAVTSLLPCVTFTFWSFVVNIILKPQLELRLIASGLSVASAKYGNPEVKADIRADSNRDGKVDLKGSSDLTGKVKWTEASGAIFLPNIGDTDRRCSKKALSGPALGNEKLDDCNDASDNIQRAPQYLAPLKTVPVPATSKNVKGTVSVPDPKQRRHVRIFHKQNNKWVHIDEKHTFTQKELKSGLELGIDARDTRRPNGWDGRVTVRFELHDGSAKSSDEVILRVAPVLTHHHLQQVEQVLAVQGNKTDEPYLVGFTESLSSVVKAAGIKKDLYLFNASDDIWAQDFVEPGYASMPGPNGAISIRIMIRSPQDERVAGRQLFEYFRKAGVGAVQHLGGARDEINSGGNIEITISSRHGALPAISRKNDTKSTPGGDCNGWSCGPIAVNPPTVAELLADKKKMELNEQCAQRIDANIKILKEEVGITDDYIIRIPALFEGSNFPGADKGKLQVGAFFPGVVNNLVLTGYHTCVAPNPWGPVVKGNDIIAEVIEAKYAKIGIKIKFIDDWNTHHNFGGEVHCGSNSVRDMSARWW
ncbi:hypothetical protein FSARC_6687 [Fusarium sarcochroum]|uniref:Protein-arginine deiminase C-terminal domain-containing protein n=1 Tax=Fusarium sarcochroum TaxID=1208366 RepID=A0A8H4X853_9HYPO|nr:hypothetical protein FSARC_6687 [Fusarium sarcochroum]